MYKYIKSKLYFASSKENSASTSGIRKLAWQITVLMGLVIFITGLLNSMDNLIKLVNGKSMPVIRLNGLFSGIVCIILGIFAILGAWHDSLRLLRILLISCFLFLVNNGLQYFFLISNGESTFY